MRVVKILFIAFGIIIYYDASAQVTASKQVIGSAGANEIASGDLSATWTAGESVIGTHTSGTITLTQGFQQSSDGASTSINVNVLNVDLNIYPNPTQDKVYLSINSPIEQTLHYVVYAPTGQIVNLPENQVLVNGFTEKEIDFSYFATGTYLLNVITEKGEQVTTIRVVKM